jgi:hypothetical protein
MNNFIVWALTLSLVILIACFLGWFFNSLSVQFISAFVGGLFHGIWYHKYKGKQND